ncbi:hypothetical protein [uncultured Polaribacter sp.]|uniref:hypothetical protein n=1 Tax=uncultured Polaribacter sp. TaxID=174711 RepID=UPI0026149044|nr:hypothetical protein [uncultured Polaribacter sp.]
MRKLLVLFSLFISTITLSQKTAVFTEEISGFNNYSNNISYGYEATVKFQLMNAGLGDVKIKVGVTNFNVTSLNGVNLDQTIISSKLPIKNAAKQFSIKGRFSVYYHNVFNGVIDFKIGMLNDGDLLDVYYLTNEQRDDFVKRHDLKKDKNRIKDLVLKLWADVELIPEGISEIRKIQSLSSSKKGLYEKYERLEKDSEVFMVNNKIEEVSTVELNKKIIVLEQIIALEEPYGKYPEPVYVNKLQFDKFRDRLKSYKDEITRRGQTTKNKATKKTVKKKKTKKEISTENWVRNQKFKAQSLYSQYNSTYNYKKKQALLKDLKRMSSYLSDADRKAFEKEVRKDNRRKVTDKVTSSLTSVNYGRGKRNILLYASTGFNYIWGDNSSQTTTSIPTLTLGMDLTFYKSRKLAFEVFGEYNDNFFVDFSGLVPVEDPGYLDGIDLSQLEETEIIEETKLSRFNYGFGVTLGRQRKYSLLLISQNVKYSYSKTTDGTQNISIGENKNIPTFGGGVSLNLQGKSKQDLGRFMVSYTINNEGLSFLSSDYENNKYSNLNAKMEGGLGALFFAVEYNLFKDDINATSVSSIGLKMGFKFGG